MTLIELVVGLAISAVLVSVLGSMIAMLVWLPQQQGDKMAAASDVRIAEQWLALDASSAITFTLGVAPSYGTFTWVDYSVATPVDYAVAYSFDSDNGYLMRTEQQDGDTTATFAVAKNVASANDVVFYWYPTSYALQVALTSTVSTNSVSQGITTTLRTASPNLSLRPRQETVDLAPANAPVPTPVSGSDTYDLQNNPSASVGSEVSGNDNDLEDIDGDYYIVASTTGYPAQMLYSVESQKIDDPKPIGSLQVRFTALSDQSNVAIDLSVRNSGSGYPAASDFSYTITTAGQAQTVYFYLDPTALAYVNALGSPRVTLRVSATAASSFTLSTDQIVFVASP